MAQEGKRKVQGHNYFTWADKETRSTASKRMAPGEHAVKSIMFTNATAQKTASYGSDPIRGKKKKK